MGRLKSSITTYAFKFLNPRSVEILLKEIGFKVIEISTPGKLDIDIMNNNIDKIKAKFWKIS